ncbi:MAG: hypothetical protein AB1633_13435 [Elusimicrobiota bacterium]
MKKIIFSISILLISNLYLYAAPKSPWSEVRKSIAMQEGITVSAWDADGRSNMTSSGRAENMTPVGNGTYESTFYLSPGTTYNFILFAYSTFSISGLTANSTYYDTVPNSGNGGMFTSTSTVSVTSHGKTWCGNVGATGDSRRLLYVPPDLPGGSTLYVYCNFSASPTVSAVSANPISSWTIRLEWTPYGSWGTGNELFKAVDVIAGGFYHIYRSSVGVSGPYMYWASTSSRSWDDDDRYSAGDNVGLELGLEYYYVVVSSDAYTGAGSQLEIANMYRGGAPEFSSSDAHNKTANSVPIYFKVENGSRKWEVGSGEDCPYKIDGANWDYIEKNDYLVYLTPEVQDARYYIDKKVGRAIRCLLIKGREVKR